MTVGSLFTGIGGFDLGFVLAGMSLRWQNEIDPKAVAVLNHHWPTIPRTNDVTTTKATELEPVDVICGGFPCQDVSLAGTRKGLSGKRSGLWQEMYRIISGALPRWIVIENVPGLLSSNEGRDFHALTAQLVECGYCLAWRTLNARFFGVPQSRRRIFIVGNFRAYGAVSVCFESESGKWYTKADKTPPNCTPPLLGSGAGTARQISLTGTDEMRYYILSTLRARAGASRPGRAGDTDQNLIPCNWNGADCLDTLDVSKLTKKQTMPERGRFPYIIDDSLRLRRLTPLECERAQGFPDNWTAIEGHSDLCRYRQLGNAVAVPVARWLGERLEQEEKTSN